MAILYITFSIFSGFPFAELHVIQTRYLGIVIMKNHRLSLICLYINFKDNLIQKFFYTHFLFTRTFQHSDKMLTLKETILLHFPGKI